MANFQVTVVTRPSIDTAGLKVRTTIQKTSIDCPKIWSEDFGPKMCGFPADPAYPDQSYGVSIMLNENEFDYWAVMPLRSGATVPAGMETLQIAGGLYAECHISSLAELGDAFTYIYGEWGGTQSKYALNMRGASYELYTSEFMKTGKMSVYCPLLEK